MSQHTCTLSLEVEFDDSKTDPESLASALDSLIKTALSTPGILQEYGDPTVGEFMVSIDQDPPDVWGEDPQYPRSDWEQEVGAHDTNLGYWDWVSHRKVSDAG
jgi:hypothetical protein